MGWCACYCKHNVENMKNALNIESNITSNEFAAFFCVNEVRNRVKNWQDNIWQIEMVLTK